MSDQPLLTLGSTRAGWWRLAAPLLLAGVALAGVWLLAGHRWSMPAASPAMSHPTRARDAGGLSRLPAQAQSVVSSAVGASDPRFAPRRVRGGLGLAGGGVAAALGGGGVSVQGGGAQLSLGLLSVGRADRLRQLPAALPQVRSHRVVYARGGGVLEWYEAGPFGIEQGFTLSRRPAGAAGAVTLGLGRSGVSARLAGSGVEFVTRSGRVALRYGGLVARDASGRRLAAWLSLSGRRLLVRVADRAARYPLRIDPLIQQGPKLTATDESGAGHLGYSVALSGDGGTALVGGYQDDSETGAAWVFTRTGGVWNQRGPKLTASDRSATLFGFSVALSWDGTTALIGAPGDSPGGAAWVFIRSGNTWTPQGPKLTSGQSGQGNFGISVALSGDGITALIGDSGDNSDVGAALVFTRSGSTWTQQGPKLTASDESTSFPGDFGSSVALSGDGSTALIGGPFDSVRAGAAWVFVRSAGTWTQQGPKLTAPDGGGDFGYSVALSLDGRTALVGSPQIDGGGTGAGGAWVFARSGTTWSVQGSKLAPTDETGQGHFGAGVALSGDGGTALIGAGGDAGNVGAAWVFARSGSTWTQQGAKLAAGDESGQGAFGSSVALSSDASTVLVGAPSDNDNAGAAWVFGSPPTSASVFWDNSQIGSIARADGTPSQLNQEFIPGLQQTHTLPLASDGQHLYWAAGGSIARANLDGSDVNKQFIQSEAGAIAVDGQHIYWTHGEAIARASLDGSGVDTQFIPVSGSLLSGLAVDSGHIYWKDRIRQSIGRANLDGTGANDEFMTGVGFGTGLAVDAQHIYWTELTGGTPSRGSVGRANLDGTDPDPNFITGQFGTFDVAVDAEHVYWADSFDCNYQTDPPSSCEGGTIGRANLDGSGVDTSFITADTATGPGCGTDPQTRCGPTSVTVTSLPDGSSAIYWDNPQIGTIGRDTISDNPGTINQSLIPSASRQTSGFPVAVDRQHVYWGNGGFLGRADLDGTGLEPQFIKLTAGARFVAVDDRYVYWANADSIGRANLDGTGVVPTLVDLQGTALVNGLAVDSSHLYWADERNQSIGRANLDGTGANDEFMTGVGFATGVAVDGQHVYWSQLAPGTALPDPGSIGRANLDGSAPDPNFITGAAEPRGLAVDFGHLYWANYYFCDFHTFPPSNCAGGTIGRANLDGSAVDQSYLTAQLGAGPGCNTDPETRCGPTSVAVTPPDQPQCLRTSPTPQPPPGGAVFARPLDPGSTDANVVVIPPGVSWTGPDSCVGIAQGSDEVMTHPASVSVAPDAAVLLKDQTHGLSSAWGAQDVGASGPAPVLFPGRSDWETTEADLVTPQQLLTSAGGCPSCALPDNLQFTPGQPDATVAYRSDVSGATMNGAQLTGDFDNWNFSGAALGGATLGTAGSTATSVSGANFDAADLRGAQLVSLQSKAPPSFANVRVGALSGACTEFQQVNLLNTGFTPVKADLLVPGCATTPLFAGSTLGTTGSTVALGVIEQLAVTDGAAVDFAGGQYVATAVDSSSLAGKDLHGIDLAGASFLGFPADLESTIFNGATLDGASFELADMANAQLQGVHAVKASFGGASLTGASFAGQTTDLNTANFARADVSGASFEDADLSNATFDGVLAASSLSAPTNFTSVIATNASFNGAHIYGDGPGFDATRQMAGADFVGAVLGGSEDGSGGFDLTNAVLTGAHFDGAQCISCNLTNATLNDATFIGAYLPGAQLTGAQLNMAKFDRAWLYCGTLTDGQCQASGGLQWTVALGSEESYGPVPFTTTTLNQQNWVNVDTCPHDADAPTAAGCKNLMIPDETFRRPACSAAALDACVTPTSTVFDSLSLTAGSPLSVVPASPPTWASTVTTDGYDVGLSDATVRLVSPNFAPQLVAGHHGTECSGQELAAGCGDGGPAADAFLGEPAGLAVGLDGSLYIADPKLHSVRRVDPSGTITTVAGNGQACATAAAACGDGGPATGASLMDPVGVWSSPTGDLFIADGRRGIREVHPDGTISTVATGTAAGTYDVVSVVGDASGNLWAASNAPDYILQITGGQTTIAVGTGTSGYNGDVDSLDAPLPGTEAQINQPRSLSVALDGNIVFADTKNNLIRAYNPSPMSEAMAADPVGLVDANGNPQGGFNSDGLPGNQTKLQSPAAVTVTQGAILIVADTGNHRVRAVGPNPPPPPPQLTSPGSLTPPVVTPPSVATPPLRGAAPPTRRRPPNNHARTTRIRTHRDGTITFSVRVPGPGRVDALATAWNDNLARAAILLHPAPHRFVYARSHARARRATTLHLSVRPNKQGRRLVRHHGYRITLRLWVSYTPTAGRPRSRGFYGLHLPRPRGS